jgi:CTP synthase (UTP-ammonia lyase)
MRLGSRKTVLQTVSCISAKLYQKELYIYERHRHRCVGVGRQVSVQLTYSRISAAVSNRVVYLQLAPAHNPPRNKNENFT